MEYGFEACLGERSNYNNSKDSSLKIKWRIVLNRLKRMAINLLTLQVWLCHQSVDFTDLAFHENLFKEKNGKAWEESSHIRRGIEFITKIRSELNFLLINMSKEAEKFTIVRSELKTRRKHERATRNSSLRATQGTAAMSCQGTSRPFSVQAVHCTFMLNNTNEWSVVSLNKHHLHIS